MLYRRLLPLFVVILGIIGIFSWILYGELVGGSPLDPPISNVSASPVGRDWPMYQRDPAHSGFLTEEILPTGALKWRFLTDGPIYSSPAIVGETVYISTGDARILAIAVDSGNLLWEHAASGPVHSTVAVAGNLVFVGLRDGKVLAIDKGNGNLEWEFKTDGFVHSSPVVANGVVYIGSSDGRLYALDALTGEHRWDYKTDGWILSNPAASDNVVGVTSQDGNLYIFDVTNGEFMLDYRLSLAIGGPVFEGNSIFIADQGGVVTAVDWRKKEPRFEKLKLRVRTQLMAWGLIDQLPPENGFIWSFYEPDIRFVGTPVIAWDHVYIASKEGRLFALDKATGRKIWDFHIEGEFNGSPSVAHQSVLVGGVDGKIHSVDAFTGEKQWDIHVGNSISATPVVANGVLYVSSHDGALYAFR